MQVPILTIGVPVTGAVFCTKFFPMLIGVKAISLAKIAGGMVGASVGVMVGARLDGIEIWHLLSSLILIMPTLVVVTLIVIGKHQDAE